MLNVFFIVGKKEAGISSRRFREDFPSHQGDPDLSVEIVIIIAYSLSPDKGVFSKIWTRRSRLEVVRADFGSPRLSQDGNIIAKNRRGKSRRFDPMPEMPEII